MSRSRLILSFTVVLLVIAIACKVSFDSSSIFGTSKSEETLQAIYAADTLQALVDASGEQPAAQAPASEDSGQAPEAVEITHTTIPGNPGSPDQEKDEIDTSNTAGQKIALGDSFRLGNFERPFTQDEMDYKKENDLLWLALAEDDDFYIFSLEIVGPGEDGTLSAHYGVEFDSDLDGRGDVLLWVKGGNHPEWTIDDVMVLRDSNDDVGGSNPVVPDTYNGNGYDDVLFSIDVLNDPDSAWQRIDPGEENTIQLAIKKGMVGGSHFMWKGWADSGLADPTKFDYNDSFSEEQAGSATENSNLYPVGQLNLMDSTCWIAYNFDATGKELGGCYQLQPTPTTKPPTAEPCPPTCTTGTSKKCCTCPGWIWTADGCRLKPPA